MNVEINKQLEFVFAIHAVIKVKYGDPNFDYDFIETPDNSYMEELVNLFDGIDLTEIDKLFKEVFSDESDAPNLGVALDENFELKYLPKFSSAVSDEDLNRIVSIIKELSEKVKWNEYVESHKEFYEDLIAKFSGIIEQVRLEDFVDFYKVEPKSFNYYPSVLMNGGFGLNDNEFSVYYLRGFIYDKEMNDYWVELPYVLECMFHEFSHPIVNNIVDKYFDLIDDPMVLYDIALDSNLHPGYSGSVRTVYYEYMVRAVAYVLNITYYPEHELDMEYMSSIGFNLLEDFINVLSNNIEKYESFEELYVNEFIPYINGLQNRKIK